MGRLYHPKNKNGRPCKVWWGYWRAARGDYRRASLATTDKDVARERLRALELAPADQSARAKAGAAERSLADALEHLIDTVYAGRRPATVSCYQQKARWLVTLLGEARPLGEIDRALCQGYRAKRLGDGASDHTVAKELSVLRLALREQGIEGVVPRVKVGYKPRKRWLTRKELGALLGALPVRRRLWVMVAAYLGPRYGELADRLEWEDIDSRTWRAHVRGTKTGEADRIVPIAAPLRPWLTAERRRVARELGGAAVGPIVERWTNARRDLAAAWWRVVGWKPPAGWSKGRNKSGKTSVAGAPRISPNDLRRTFASWLKQAGVDSLVVARLLGHSSTRMVELVYGQLDERSFERAVARLPGAPAVPRAERARNAKTGRASERTRATRETAKEAANGGFVVPRGGIEPPTRGFSGPVLVALPGGKRGGIGR